MTKSRKKSHTNNTEQLKTDPTKKNLNINMKMRASDVPNDMFKNAKNTNRHTKTLGDIIISL